MPQHRKPYDDSKLPAVGAGTAAQLRAALGRERPDPRSLKRTSTITEREYRALELCAAGASYTQIGKLFSITTNNAMQLVDTALAKRASEISRTDIDQTRALVITQLQALWRRWWPLALGGDGTPPDKDAADMILKIHDRLTRIQRLDNTVHVEASIDVRLSIEDETRRREAVLADLAEIHARQHAIDAEFRETAA